MLERLVLSTEVIPFESSTLKLAYTGISPDSSAIFPRVRICFEILYTSGEATPKRMFIDDFVFDLLLRKEGRDYFVGSLSADTPYLRAYPQTSHSLNTFLDLDLYRLRQIEKLREGGNILFHVRVRLATEMEGKNDKKLCNFEMSFKVAKSEWVEEILSNIGFKEVSLIEIPKIHTQEYEKVLGWIDNAWKQYMMGEYDRVLGDCRKALEGLTDVVKEKGFEKTIVEDDKKQKVPDWRKFFASEDIGDIFGSMVQKMFGFTTVGTHFGKGINREDANLALMTVHSMIDFVVKKTPSIT